LALVDDHVALFGIDFNADRLECAAAICGAVAGIDVEVERPETEGAMVSGGIAEGLYLLAAMCTDEGLVNFGESFVFKLHACTCLSGFDQRKVKKSRIATR
jgi:hypothetical protein